MENDINVRRIYYFILAFLLVFSTALSIDVIDRDAAQYAAMSREMLVSKNWLEIHNGYEEYLDKPPLLFWLSAFSFKIFGISNWAYKLPSFLFALLGIFSTSRLGELLYDRKTGAVAALLLTTSLGFFIMTNDIRTDTILLGSVVFALWQLLLYVKTKRWMNLIGGFAGIGLAMLAKGPLGIVFPAMALSCDFAYKRQWKNFVRWQWLAGLVIVAVMLFPMCYGLYHQFDLHPEKLVNGHKGVSGLRFYFWTQSFGRITGESDWGTKYDNGAGPFFFTHTFLWVFFPWCIFFIAALMRTLIMLVKSRFKKGILPEMLSAGGFILVFLALSASKYKLPHYIYVTLPLAALLAARYVVHDVVRFPDKMAFKIFRVVHWVIFAAIAFVCGAFLFWFFPGGELLTITAVILLLLTGIIFSFRAQQPFSKLMYPLLFGLLALYFAGNVHFYPRLMNYQATAQAGRIIEEKNIPRDRFYLLDANEVYGYPLDFYSRSKPVEVRNVPGGMDSVIAKKGEVWLYTDDAGYDEVKKSGHTIAAEWKFDNFSVQFLTINFLRPETRPSTLHKRYLLEVTK